MRGRLPVISLPELPYNAVMCRYSEIGLKGRNRSDFERRLARNLKRTLRELRPFRLTREKGRIFLAAEEDGELPSGTSEVLRRTVGTVFGVQSVSPGFVVAPMLEAVDQTVERTFAYVYEAVARELPEDRPVRYAMRARRSTREFPLSSRDLEIRFADRLLDRYPRLRVDLEDPVLQVQVEIRRDRAFISYETIPGPGGLPTGTGGNVLALLSGGIDSPVACYDVMRRGCVVHFVTFHSHPYTPPATVRKVAQLAHCLRRYQGPSFLFAVNLADAQKVIRDCCAERMRTILYRRLMMRIACRLAEAVGAPALVSGDNLGQVASQTLPNLTAISEAAPVPVLRPLIGRDKQEIVAEAERIGTFETSREEVPDSCTVFAPRHPATAASVAAVRHEEEKLRIDELVRMSLGTAVLVNTKTGAETPLAESDQEQLAALAANYSG